MSYLSPTPILLKDSVTNYKGFRKAKRFNNTLKSQLIHTSFYAVKDPQARKPALPDIIIPERKPIHGRSTLIKIQTLPMIKGNESDLDTKSQQNLIDPLSTESIQMPLPISVISVQKNIKTSVKKIKLQALLKPEQKKSPTEEVRIEITSCENIVSGNKRIIDKMQSDFLYPPIRSPSISTISKISSRRTLSPVVSRSSSLSDRKIKSEDPFFYLNILRNLNFTSFNCILDVRVDAYNNTFPYICKIIKVITKIKPLQKTMYYKLPRGYCECTCKCEEIVKCKENSERKIEKIPKVWSAEDMAGCVPGLRCIKMDLQHVKYESHVIILNFEGVLGCFLTEICIKPGTLRIIKKLGKYFRIVLVVETSEEKMDKILSIFVKLSICLSAIYQRQGTLQNCELEKLQDYSQVYKDFLIQDPERQVIIIASHKYIDNIKDNPQEVISIKSGLSQKLCIERPPIPCENYEQTPATVLLPDYKIKHNSRILKRLLRQIKFVEKIDFNKQHLNFKSLFTNHQYLAVHSTVVHQMILNFFGVDEKKALVSFGTVQQNMSKHLNYCKLHDKYVSRDSDTLCENVFIVN